MLKPAPSPNADDHPHPVRTNSPLTLEVRARWGPGPNDQEVRVRDHFKRGEWARIVIKWKIDPHGKDGRCEAWMNDHRFMQYKGKLGFAKFPKSKTVTNKFGIWRKHAFLYQMVRFDEIKLVVQELKLARP